MDPLSFQNFKWMCTLLLQSEKKHHVLARTMFTLSWNLICRASNVVTICYDHLEWQTDSLGIFFAQTKTDQMGSKPRDARHVYANPICPEVCPILALGIYMLCFPSTDYQQVFPGHDQYDRYSKMIRDILSSQSQADLHTRGIIPENIGTHSLRKGAATFVSSGSTACPPSSAINLRAGWKMGGVADTYLRYESAGDQFVGRTVCGLPPSQAEFALLPPFFRDESNPSVTEALTLCFPNISGKMMRVAKFALASVVFHSEKLTLLLPKKHPLFSTALFTTNSLLQTLSGLVECRLAQTDDDMQPTGVPPHTTLISASVTLAKNVAAIVPKIRQEFINIIDDREMTSGVVTTHGLKEVLKVALDELGINEILKRTTAQDLRTTAPIPQQPAMEWHMMSDGIRRVPADFSLPKGTTLAAWQHYCCGNASKGYPPFRTLTPSDMPDLKIRKRFSDFMVLMRMIRHEIDQQGAWIDRPTMQQANAMFEKGRIAIDIPKPAKRRSEQLDWSTTLNIKRKRLPDM